MRLTDLVTAEAQAREAREEFLEVLDEFRHTAVLVPLDERGGLWSAEFGGIRWIMAFSDEESLARFALARADSESGRERESGPEWEAGREWEYRKVLGSRLLDTVVPAVGAPCGVALDAAGEDGKVFPPVAGIVPDKAAVDAVIGDGGRA